MHYKIYIDKLWLMDFGMNTYLLLLVRKTYGLKSRLARVFFSAASNAVIFVLLLILPGLRLWERLLLQAVPANLLLLQAAFSFRTKEMVVKSYICMSGYGLLFGGTLFFLSFYLPVEKGELTSGKVLLAGGMTALAVYGYLYYRKKSGKNGGFYAVKLDFYGETLSCRGFADSGNSLYEPYGKRPVAVLEKQAAGELLERVPQEKHYLVPYHSIGKKHGLLPAVELPVMEVDSGEHKETFHKVVVALAEGKLSGNQEYQLILHPEFVRQEE